MALLHMRWNHVHYTILCCLFARLRFARHLLVFDWEAVIVVASDAFECALDTIKIVVAGAAVNDLDDSFTCIWSRICLGVAATSGAGAIIPESEALTTCFTIREMIVVDGAVSAWSTVDVRAPGGRQEIHPAIV